MLVRFTRVHARLLPRVNPRYAQFCYYTYLESFTNIYARLLPRVNPSRSFIPTFLPLSKYLFHLVMGPASDLLTSPSNDAFKFPKLNGTNYSSWSGYMKSALQSKYLWLIVTGDEDRPPDAAADAKDTEKRTVRKERLEWKLRDQAAMGNIKGACENSQLPFVERETITSAKAMWNELKKIHQTSLSKINVHYIFRRNCEEESWRLPQ